MLLETREKRRLSRDSPEAGPFAVKPLGTAASDSWRARSRDTGVANAVENRAAKRMRFNIVCVCTSPIVSLL